MASQVYFEGDFYYAKTACAAGESPSTHPAQWQVISIPAELEELIVAEAAARIMEGLSKPEEARQQRLIAHEERTKRTLELARRQARNRPMRVTNRG